MEGFKRRDQEAAYAKSICIDARCASDEQSQVETVRPGGETDYSRLASGSVGGTWRRCRRRRSSETNTRTNVPSSRGECGADKADIVHGERTARRAGANDWKAPRLGGKLQSGSSMHCRSAHGCTAHTWTDASVCRGGRRLSERQVRLRPAFSNRLLDAAAWTAMPRRQVGPARCVVPEAVHHNSPAMKPCLHI